MKKITNGLVMLLLITAASCTTKTEETPNGFKYIVEKSGDGVLPKVGEILVFDYTMQDSHDSVWADTRKLGMPAAVMIADLEAEKNEKGIMQMFRRLSKGDSVKADIPIKKFFEEIVGAPVPKKIDSTLTITYLIHVSDITTREKYSAKQQELETKMTAEQLVKDAATIDKYLTEEGITAQKTESGIRYVITQPGNGPTATTGQTVKVHYTGYLLNGQYFDSSVKAIAQEKGFYNPQREPYAPMDVVVDRTQVISGWHDALKTLNKGAKGTFYIPSTLGYGRQRASATIVENSILVFDIEALDITNGQEDQRVK
jgi:FKBP-type peptidyl-prolyl cis-trans isomerase FkpA